MDLNKMDDVIVAPDRRQNDQAAPAARGRMDGLRVDTVEMTRLVRFER
jgi:hypothetical protein